MARVSNMQVAVQQGSGVVARYGEVAAVLSRDDDGGFTVELIAALQSAEAHPTQAADVAWQLAGLLQRHRRDAPAFAVSAPVAEGQLLLLHGAAAAVADSVTITGRDTLTWVDHVLTAPVRTIALTLGDEPTGEPDPHSDLRAGVVPGAGVVITFAVEQTPAQEPAEAIAGEPAGSATEVIGEPIADDEPEPTERAVATLVADDGTRTPLDRPYVFGRDPNRDDAVSRGAATGLVVNDPDNAISRVHTYLWVNEHGVYVRDANSSNGTFIAAPGAADWDRLGDQPAELPVGWSMRIGRRIFTHVGAYG